jgi:hypothetical protein
MKILTRIFLFVVIVALLLLVGSLFIPRNWEASAATVIQAEPGEVFDTVNHLHTWGEWTAWTKEKYPEMTRTFEGPGSGKGAVMIWDDGKMEGRLEVVNSVAPNAIDYDLFMDDRKTPMRGSFEFMPDAGGTRAIWVCSGEDANPMSKYMMLFFKPMMTKDFETGLANLKARIEQDVP